jgi:hypothetical protein
LHIAFAGVLGIPSEHVLAEVLPQGKANQMKRLQKQRLVVAFAGDGINKWLSLPFGTGLLKERKNERKALLNMQKKIKEKVFGQERKGRFLVRQCERDQSFTGRQ